MSDILKRRLRCAVYTRKSSEEGLDQEYNSIDAQRDAGHAYIASQRAEGWIPVGDDYDDPAFSGGNMARPALKRLMADIEEGKIDTVVVYKIDRLTRSLADFSKMVEVFERLGVSFVAVTQQFNTTTSMGRLMLNVLLSFAQFEREVTGERIRDKITASKKKGMWMGGIPPLGYDVANRRLVINDKEAKLIRHIFTRFVELGSGTLLVKELRLDCVTSKAWTTQDGRVRAGKPIDKSLIYKLLITGPTWASCGIKSCGTRQSIHPSSIRNCGTMSMPSWPPMVAHGAMPPERRCPFCSKALCSAMTAVPCRPGAPPRRKMVVSTGITFRSAMPKSSLAHPACRVCRRPSLNRRSSTSCAA